METLEVRFIEAEINKELFDKYSTIYANQLAELKIKLKAVSLSSSNLEKMVDKGIELAQNISDLWVSSSFDTRRNCKIWSSRRGFFTTRKLMLFELLRSILFLLQSLY